MKLAKEKLLSGASSVSLHQSEPLPPPTCFVRIEDRRCSLAVRGRTSALLFSHALPQPFTGKFGSSLFKAYRNPKLTVNQSTQKVFKSREGK